MISHTTLKTSKCITAYNAVAGTFSPLSSGNFVRWESRDFDPASLLTKMWWNSSFPQESAKHDLNFCGLLIEFLWLLHYLNIAGVGISGTCVNFALNTCLTHCMRLHEVPRNVMESVPLQPWQFWYFSVTNDSFFPLSRLQDHWYIPMAKVYCSLFENAYEITFEVQRDCRCSWKML